MAPRLILASNSIRRYDLLGQVGIIPDIIDPSNVDETIYDQSLPPHQIALMLARKKRILYLRMSNIKMILY